MSSSQYQRQLEAKRRQRLDAEKKVGDFRSKEADKRAAASKAVESASRTTNASMAASRLREAGRSDAEANAAGKEAARWQNRAAGYIKDEAALQAKLAKAQQAEQEDAERAVSATSRPRIDGRQPSGRGFMSAWRRRRHWSLAPCEICVHQSLNGCGY